jgi:spore germination protein PC
LFNFKGSDILQQELIFYLNQLAAKIKKQEEQLAKLEKNHEELRKTIDSLKKQPPVNVERIEYHFDQLKIEKLDGTLNIGLNPNDLQGMDEFSIATNNQIPPFFQNPTFIEQVRNKLNDYIDQELPKVIEDMKNKLNLQLDNSFTQFIQEDIRKQMPDRIQFYIQKLTQENSNRSQEKQEQELIQRIVQDISQAVNAFLKQFQTKGDGGNDNGSDQP